MEAALHSSDRHDWQTPPDVLELVRQLGPIRLDPCTTPENPTGAVTWVAPPEDGLDVVWNNPGSLTGGLVFVNPPYGRQLPLWVDHCAYYGKRATEIVLLTPARTDTRWFRVIWSEARALCFWNGRMRFVGAPAPAPFPSLLTYWGPVPWAFCHRFSDHGCVQVLR